MSDDIQFLVILKEFEGEEKLRITDLNDGHRISDLFTLIRDLLPDLNNCKITLCRLVPELQELTEEEKYSDELIFTEECETKEIDEQNTMVVEYEIYIFPKLKLKVYFFAEVNSENEYTSKSIIQQGVNQFLQKEHNKVDYLSEFDYIFTEKIGTIEKEEDIFKVVITAGRYTLDVMKFKENIDSIIIYTSKELLENFNKTYNKEKFPQVKNITSNYRFLIKDDYLKIV